MYIDCMKTKENLLLLFTSNQFRLNKYDNKFFLHLVVLIAKNKFITTNQVELFDKLLLKYKRQLKKLGYNYNTIINLEWDTKVIGSDTDHTQAHIEIIDGKIKLRLPFNRKFIEDWHTLQREKKVNIFVWDKSDKCYYGKATTFGLKFIHLVVSKYFKVNYSKSLQEQIDILEIDKTKIYDPTLVKINSNNYVLACNQQLSKVLNNIDWSYEPYTLHQLSKLGVHVHTSITNGNKFFEFCSKYHSQLSSDEFLNLKQYLLDLNIPAILLSQRFYRVNKMIDNLLPQLSGLIILDHNQLDNMQPRPFVYLHYGYLLKRPISIPDNWKMALEKEIYFKDNA